MFTQMILLKNYQKKLRVVIEKVLQVQSMIGLLKMNFLDLIKENVLLGDVPQALFSKSWT